MAFLHAIIGDVAGGTLHAYCFNPFLHAGTFLCELVSRWRTYHSKENEIILKNLSQVISHLYQFKVLAHCHLNSYIECVETHIQLIGSSIVFSVIDILASTLSECNVETILVILNSGYHELSCHLCKSHD